MPRTLAPGRLTKLDLGEAARRNGLINSFGNKGVFGDYMDQLLFEAHGYEHILGSDAQVSSDFATITWDQINQRFEDKDGTEVLLGNHDRVAVIGMDTLTANIVINNITGLEIFHIGSTPGQAGDNPKFQMGDAGSGVPFKILLGPGTQDCKLDLQTDKDFRDLLNFTLGAAASDPDNARYVSNQGRNNRIKINGYDAYKPAEAGQIIKLDTPAINPYLLRMNGQIIAFAADVSVNNSAWFRDLNIALDGYRSDGTNLIETASRFTSVVSAFLSQLNTANRFFTDISSADSRINLRTDPTGVSIAGTADFVNTSNTVTFQGGIGNVKNGMRINGAFAEGIPDAALGTTILRNINTTAGTAQMFDALTGVAVPATSTNNGVPVTLDNSGAAGGSHDEDTFQGHAHETWFSNSTGAGSVVGENTAANMNFLIPTSNIIDDGISGVHRAHDQTQPISSGIYYYYKA